MAEGEPSRLDISQLQASAKVSSLTLVVWRWLRCNCSEFEVSAAGQSLASAILECKALRKVWYWQWESVGWLLNPNMYNVKAIRQRLKLDLCYLSVACEWSRFSKCHSKICAQCSLFQGISQALERSIINFANSVKGRSSTSAMLCKWNISIRLEFNVNHCELS